jgi:two-component system, sensor histidine kinase YesM
MHLFRRWNFSKKLFAFFAMFSILPVTAFGFISYSISMRLSMLNLEQNVKTALKSAQDNLNRCLEEYESALDYFCRDKDVINIISSEEPNRRYNELYQKMYIMLAGRQQTAAQMHLIKADGSFSLSTSKIPKMYDIRTFGNWGIYRALKGSVGSILYSNCFTSASGIKYSISVAHTIQKDGKVVGYAIIDLPSVIFANALENSNSIFSSFYTIFDSHYYILYSQTTNDIFLDKTLRARMESASQDQYFLQNDSKQLVEWRTLDGHFPITILSYTSIKGTIESTNFIMMTALIVTLITIGILLVCSPFIVKILTRPLNSIIRTMEQVQSDNTLARVPVYTKDEFGFIATNLNKTLDTIDELYQNNMEKQERLRTAEIKSLYSQINPHFLYNTLDTIKWLAKLKSTNEIVTIVSQLGHLLKYTISNCNELIPLKKEINLVQSYIAIQQIRYGDKFTVTFDVDESLTEYIIPKLILQPLVENAIIHGIENKIGKSCLAVCAYRKENGIVLEVKDNGIGMSREKLLEVRQSLAGVKSESIGLSNVHRRIMLYYGKKYGVTIQSEENVGTTVDILLPEENLLHERKIRGDIL